MGVQSGRSRGGKGVTGEGVTVARPGVRGRRKRACGVEEKTTPRRTLDGPHATKSFTSHTVLE